MLIQLNIQIREFNEDRCLDIIAALEQLFDIEDWDVMYDTILVFGNKKLQIETESEFLTKIRSKVVLANQENCHVSFSSMILEGVS